VTPPWAVKIELADPRGDVMGTVEIDRGVVARAYARWAPVYDVVFGSLFDAGRKETIAAAGRVGGRILDVGIGTGISLTRYPRTVRIVGIDASEAMLRQAQKRLYEEKLIHVEALALMDAERLAFTDASFDAVVAQYVITTISNPEVALDELARVTRIGGEIILVNHLAAEMGPARIIEKSIAPVTRQLGWSLNFDWTRLSGWMVRHGGVLLLERRSISPLGQFSLIRLMRTNMAPQTPLMERGCFRAA
jgi:phosphatidylethanolamine/phosphatidyl-N-methylethanolamine N-methyltransferase